MRTLITNGKLVLENSVEENLNLLIEDTKIVRIQKEKTDADVVIDAKGSYVSPGFIDIHTHGGNGFDFMDGDAQSFIGASTFHMQYGTTSIVPTTLSATDEEIMKSFEGFREAKKQMVSGPEMLGLHLEGPYFSQNQRGAQDPKFIKNPDRDFYLRLLDSTDDLVRWSVAPELEGALELGDELTKRGILASIGHSDAMYEDVKKAIEHGYSHVTHLYSGMSSLKRVSCYRVLGLVECAFLFDELTIEIIADSKHLPPELLKMILKCKPHDKISLVTDSLRCAGAKNGTTALSGSRENGQEVIIEDDVAKMPDRRCFAGSICTSNLCVKNMYKLVGLPLYEAVKMMSLNPAKVMKVDDKKGSIAPAKDADIVIFDDELNVQRVLCKGRVTK